MASIGASTLAAWEWADNAPILARKESNKGCEPPYLERVAEVSLFEIWIFRSMNSGLYSGESYKPRDAATRAKALNFATSVSAGLKTRFPGLKSGAGTIRYELWALEGV
jgi:hypothetical protein